MSKNAIYTEELLYYFKYQPYKKTLNKFDYIGFASNNHCGDNIEVTIKVKDGLVVDVGYKADGCAVSQSYMSMLAEEIIGKSINDVLSLSDDFINDLMKFELTQSRKNCAMVGLRAVKNCKLV